MGRRKTSTSVPAAVAADLQILREQALGPLDPKDLTAKGYELDGSPSPGTTYPDLIGLVLREDPQTFDRKMDAITMGDYSLFTTTKEVLVRLAVQRARLGSDKDMAWLAEREEGKAAQTLLVGTTDKTQSNLAAIRQAVQLGQPPTAEIKLISEGETDA